MAARPSNPAPSPDGGRMLQPQVPHAVTFLGFCGAPWTVATYMIAGQGTPDQLPARLFAYRHPESDQPTLGVRPASTVCRPAE